MNTSTKPQPHPLDEAWTLIQRALTILHPLQPDPETTRDWMTDDESGVRSVHQFVDHVQREAHTLCTHLIERVCWHWHQEHPNVPISYNDIVQQWTTHHGREHFEYQHVINLLNATYLKTASTSALHNLHSQAQRLLPHQHPGTLDALLFDSTLRLHCYLERDFQHPSNRSLSHHCHESIMALWKLARVLLDNREPVSISPSPTLSQHLFTYRHNITAQTCSAPPLSFRFFKNGRLDVTCESSTAARRIADALLSPLDPPH